VPDLRWESVPDMDIGTWVEIPVDEDGPPQWVPVVAVMPPSWTGERRWALAVGDEAEPLWIKVAPHLMFRTADEDPSAG
jgi:hypothetical protein